jgi:methylenetetrahydrofolate reductase (NADPH)
LDEAMQTLREKLYQTSNFLYGVELVSIRGTMAEKSAIKARTFAGQLIDCSQIDWISITDNAGGNPQLAPVALAKPILYSGKETVIHLTCKDLNRNGLESEAWFLNSEGFHNILAMTGDYPVTGNQGMAKPVFDIDSVGLISMLNKMNNGFDLPRHATSGKAHQLGKTQFLIGAVTTNFKLLEGEVMPQYFKLQKKVECGANFIINQIGYDSRKIHELRLFMDNHGMKQTPLIGNVYILNPKVAQLFHEEKIPGVVVTKDLFERCIKESRSADQGRSFFCELAAKQIAIYKGLGYRGAYLGGAHDFSGIERVLEIERTFSSDDWKEFVSDVSYSRPNEFFFYSKDLTTGLSDATARDTTCKERTKPVSLTYHVSKWAHENMFTRGSGFAKWGEKICRNAKDPAQGPKVLRAVELLSKSVLFDCKDCGDCSLPDIAYLCPESQCAKNQRNGPCGGTHDGHCEVEGYGDCIWLRAYDRLKKDGTEQNMLRHSPVIQNQGLRGTSAWANNWLGLDHTSKEQTGNEFDPFSPDVEKKIKQQQNSNSPHEVEKSHTEKIL